MVKSEMYFSPDETKVAKMSKMPKCICGIHWFNSIVVATVKSKGTIKYTVCSKSVSKWNILNCFPFLLLVSCACVCHAILLLHC